MAKVRNNLIKKPKLEPSEDYSYLKFQSYGLNDFIEVYLPDGSSYTASNKDLILFLRQSGVDNVEGLLNHIQNFRSVIWKREGDRYHYVPSSELFEEDNVQELI